MSISLAKTHALTMSVFVVDSNIKSELDCLASVACCENIFQKFCIKMQSFVLINILCTSALVAFATSHASGSIVVNTWNFTQANARAWQELEANHTAIDAIEKGCSQCEMDQCDGTVGWGGSPSETGETTLDAMIMDGETYDVGAVGGLRRVKSAISVARLVLERTEHTLLVGDMATQFAVSLGFKEESLSSNKSIELHRKWLANKCQPNYWKNVLPDPKTSCGPYHLPRPSRYSSLQTIDSPSTPEIMPSHDTIGMLAMDAHGHIAAGTSTNGLINKILGRVGDSPVPGAGAYAAKEAGAASATGDGDIMMRFLLSYQAVENLRQGLSAQQAADDTILRQAERTQRPWGMAAVIVLAKDGSYGAACIGIETFTYVVSDDSKQVQSHKIDCHRRRLRTA